MAYINASIRSVKNFDLTRGTAMLMSRVFVSNEYRIEPHQSGAIFDDVDTSWYEKDSYKI